MSTGGSGGGDMTCPACGCELRQVGTGVGCDSCGLYMGPGGASGVSEKAAQGGGGGGMAGSASPYLSKIMTWSNPFLPELPTMVKKGDRVGFEVHYGPDAGHIMVGVVASVDTDEDNGTVQIVLEDDTVTSLEV